MEPIRNKVKESGLLPMDLGELLPDVQLREIDLSTQLWQGLVLKEKDFRTWVSTEDWSTYQDALVRIHCATDAIIPTWAYMLVASALEPFTSNVVAGSAKEVEHYWINLALAAFDKSAFQDQRVIVKGCAKLLDQEYALTRLVMELKPYVKSLMFGEPCSTVPIFKRS
ncbi:MAG: DUF2480 family protein, partial [Bacteroidota bacterium]